MFAHSLWFDIAAFHRTMIEFVSCLILPDLIVFRQVLAGIATSEAEGTLTTKFEIIAFLFIVFTTLFTSRCGPGPP